MPASVTRALSTRAFSPKGGSVSSFLPPSLYPPPIVGHSTHTQLGYHLNTPASPRSPLPALVKNSSIPLLQPPLHSRGIPPSNLSPLAASFVPASSSAHLWVARSSLGSSSDP